LVSPCEAHRHDRALNPAKTEVALLRPAMIKIFSDDAQRVQKRMLGMLEPNAMLCPIGPVLCGIPLKIGRSREPSIYMLILPY
jgi:hypothetical protein